MGTLFIRKLFGYRTPPDAVELALDLAPDAITLHERDAHGVWKKFAAAQLDDPELPTVIGLLRTEVEEHAGGHRPVRIWLPGEQVLKLLARIKGETPAVRLRAAFDYIDRETVYRRKDVAVAVAPANRNGETTILITFAETWRESRNYVTRWGFLPGDISTRHYCSDFGADGPVFQMDSSLPDPLAPIRRNRLGIAWLALFAAITGAAVWSLQPWAAPTLPDPVSGPATNAAIEVAEGPATPPPASTSVTAAPLPAPEPVPETVIEIAEAPATQLTALRTVATPLPVPELAPVPKLEIRIAILPPRHFPDNPVLTSPGIPLSPPNIGTAPGRLSSMAVPAALPLPNAIAAAPSAPPILEPAPLAHDPVTAWTGPLPELHPLGPISPTASMTASKEIPKVMEAPFPATGITLLAENGITFLKPPTTPVVQPPPAETTEPITVTAETAEITPAALPVPIPIPRPARSAPPVEFPVSGPKFPLAKILPPPKPARPGQPAAEPGETIAAVTPTDAPAAAPDPAPVAVPPDTSATITPDTVTPNRAEDPDAPTKYATLTAPRPKSRPVLPVLPRFLPPASPLPALTGPIRRSIQAAATEAGLPLKQTTLIGILNFDTGRKALLRLSNGRYRAVIVGDVLDGWRVSMIGVDAMRMTRSGEDVTLLLVTR